MDQFQRVKLIIPEDTFNELQRKRVVICGVGGVGGIAAEALIRTGVTKLLLIDYDVVELSNLNRQIQANHETLGQPKTKALKDKLLLLNPQAEIDEVRDFVDQTNFDQVLTGQIDYVIDAIDSVNAKTELIQYCHGHQYPIISSCGMGNRFNPSLIQVSRLDKTFNDPLAKALRLKLRGSGYEKTKVVFSSEKPIIREKPVASLSFVVNVAGLFLASEVLKDLGVRNYEI